MERRRDSDEDGGGGVEQLQGVFKPLEDYAADAPSNSTGARIGLPFGLRSRSDASPSSPTQARVTSRTQIVAWTAMAASIATGIVILVLVLQLMTASSATPHMGIFALFQLFLCGLLGANSVLTWVVLKREMTAGTCGGVCGSSFLLAQYILCQWYSVRTTFGSAGSDPPPILEIVAVLACVLYAATHITLATMLFLWRDDLLTIPTGQTIGDAFTAPPAEAEFVELKTPGNDAI